MFSRSRRGVPVPVRVYERGKGNGEAQPNASATGDVLTGGQAGEGFAEALIAYANDLAQGVVREAVLGGTAESSEYGSIEFPTGHSGPRVAMKLWTMLEASTRRSAFSWC